MYHCYVSKGPLFIILKSTVNQYTDYINDIIVEIRYR